MTDAPLSSENRLEQWIEVEDVILTDQPMVYRGKGRACKRVPDPETPPKEFFLFIWHCTRKKRGIHRRRGLEQIKVSGEGDIGKKLEAYLSRPDVILIENKQLLEYANYLGEPVRREL